VREPEQAQLPEAQVVPVPQAAPQLPQLFESVVRFTHWPLQSVVPLGHAQAPETHACPLEQTWLQAPQWRAELPVSTHSLPQRTVPGGQGQFGPWQASQTPRLHVPEQG